MATLPSLPPFLCGCLRGLWLDQLAASPPSLPSLPPTSQFEEDFDPNEIFNMFFGNMGPFGMAGGNMGPNVRVFRTGFGGAGMRGGFPQGGAGAAPAGSAQQRNPLTSMFQLLPLLLLFLFTFFNTGPPEAAYSLMQSSKYVHARATHYLEVPYYVKDPTLFERSYPPESPKRRFLEQSIATEYKTALEEMCYKEKWASRMRAPRAPAAQPTSYCDRLREMEEKMTRSGRRIRAGA